MDHCYNSGDIVNGSESETAGLVAKVSEAGTISNCYNTGKISVDDGNAGGIAGESTGTIENCFNEGSVMAPHTLGGIAGLAGGTIINCYNTGEITRSGVGGNAVYGAGIVAGVKGTSVNLINCYNFGKTLGSGEHAAIISIYANATVTNCYYLEGSGSSDGKSVVNIK